MAYLLYLSRLAPDLRRELLVSPSEWEAATKELEGLRLCAGENTDTQEVQVQDPSTLEWNPLWWVDAQGGAHSTAEVFFNDDAQSRRHFAYTVRLAARLSACWYGDAGEFYYLPEWHHLFSLDDHDPEVVTRAEVLEYRRRYGGDITNLRERLDQLWAASPPPVAAVHPQPPPPSGSRWRTPNWWWLGGAVVLYLVTHLIRSLV